MRVKPRPSNSRSFLLSKLHFALSPRRIMKHYRVLFANICAGVQVQVKISAAFIVYFFHFFSGWLKHNKGFTGNNEPNRQLISLQTFNNLPNVQPKNSLKHHFNFCSPLILCQLFDRNNSINQKDDFLVSAYATSFAHLVASHISSAIQAGHYSWGIALQGIIFRLYLTFVIRCYVNLLMFVCVCRGKL